MPQGLRVKFENASNKEKIYMSIYVLSGKEYELYKSAQECKAKGNPCALRLVSENFAG